MGYITELTLQHYDASQSDDPHRCHQFPGSAKAHALRLRWHDLPPQRQREHETPLTQAEQEEWDRLTELFQLWQDQRQRMARPTGQETP